MDTKDNNYFSYLFICNCIYKVLENSVNVFLLRYVMDFYKFDVKAMICVCGKDVRI